MRRCVGWVLLLFLMTGCSADANRELDCGMELRGKVLKADVCSFTADVAANYDGLIFTFTADCETDHTGKLSFTLRKPDTISGICGSVSGEKGQLTFSDTALEFPAAAKDLPGPITAPWLLMNALRSGFIVSAGREADCIRLSVDDTFDDTALRLDIRMNSENLPIQADVLHDGLRILTMNVTNFVIS